MWSWEKRGLIFSPQTYSPRPEWMDQFAQAPFTLDCGHFIRVYFSCRKRPDCNGQYVSYTSFVDLDRDDLTKVLYVSDKPILELGGTGCFDQYGIYPASVIRHGDNVLAYYTGHTRCESVPFDTAIGLATSKDGGSTFERVGSGPVLGASAFEPFVISGPKIKRFNNLFYLFYISGQEWIEYQGSKEVVFKIRLACSEDGLNWRRINKNIIPDKLGSLEVQASPDVFFANGRYHMFFSYMKTPDFRFDNSMSYRIGYAWSADLFSWNREDDRVGIDVSKQGFDSQMICYPHVFVINSKTYMLYLGNSVGKEGFALAELQGELA